MIVPMRSLELFAPPLRVLLAGCFDYAGLFPPARLTLPQALTNFREHIGSAEAWALGRFVVAVSRLSELQLLLENSRGVASGPTLPLSAVIGPDHQRDIGRAAEFSRSAAPLARIESVELKVPAAGELAPVLAAIPPEWTVYLEVPFGTETPDIITAMADGPACAKLRTGGLTPDAFPSAEAVVRALEQLAGQRTPFKATAGLHHPWRGSFRLGYEDGAPSATMFGYLNLLLSAATLWGGGDHARATAALLEADPASLHCDAESLTWRDQRLDLAALEDLRSGFFHGIGTCSFREPMDELPRGDWT